MERSDIARTLPQSSAQEAVLGGRSAVEIADLLLLSVLRHNASAIFLEPHGHPGTGSGDYHAVRYEQSGLLSPLCLLESELAEAVIARLSLLAGLQIPSQDQLVGRFVVRGKSATPPSGAALKADVFLATGPTKEGRSAELRRLVGRDDETQSGVGAVHDDDGDARDRVGPYRLFEELGRGGMGIVYRGEHVVLQKPVAIKVLHAGESSDPEAVARLVMEARAACRARHPGIVDVTDFGRLPDRRAYLVMELIDGDTLEAQLRDGPLRVHLALEFAIQIADALAAAGSSGVVHRDHDRASPDASVPLRAFRSLRLRLPRAEFFLTM